MLLDKIPKISNIDRARVHDADRNEKTAGKGAVSEASANARGTLTERIAAFAIGFMLLFIILLTATQALCFWIPNWWRAEYAKYDTLSNVRGEMSLDDAVHVTEDMLNYCIGRLDTLDDSMATIDGVSTPFFTEREKQHLSDCRELFLKALRARAICLLMTIALFIYIYVHRGRRDALRICARGYLISLAAVLVLAAVIAVMAIYNFTFVFTKFHHIFFDNDLWILYPDKDNLINIMQEDVFSDAAAVIGCIWAAVSAVMAIAALRIVKITKAP